MSSSSHAPSLNDLNQEHDDRENQKDVNESTQGVRADQPQQPQDGQYDGNGPQHFASPIFMTWWLASLTAYAAANRATFGLRPVGD
jgi:hypothetical protein